MKNKSLNLKTKQLFKKAVSLITAAVMAITILPLQPMTAYAEGTPEVLWGTSADSLTNSGTWEQLYNILNTEKENTSINYVKTNKSDVVVLYDLPVYKELTVDIAGHNLRLTSGGFISAKVPGVTVTVLDTAENDGTLMGNCARIIFIEGTLNLEGGKFENNFADGAVITSGGASTCVDISRHPDPEGITINYLMAELSEENFKNQFNLPEGYAWFDSENNAVTAMKPYNIYTVGKSSEGITYNVTVNYTIGGGDVTAQPSAATEGTAVNITVSPYYNRELVSLKVKQGDTEIPVTDNQFIMPAGDVVIYPEFRVINPTIEVTAADGTVTLTDVFWQAMAAVENSTSLETTVKLLDNITIPSHDHDVSKGVFTFNLNGKTINGSGDEAALDFGADTKVVITGNGTVENAVDAIKTASDSLTIDNGNFTGTKNAINICGGNTTINSGTFTVDYNSGRETAVNLTGGKAVINGGSFTSVSVALNIEHSEAEVNGGTFTAPNAISIYIDGKLSISGNASIDGEYFDINNSSFGTPVIITSEIDANAPISLITGYAGAQLAKGADGITLNPDWFASADPGKIIYYNQTDNTIYLKECTHSWSEDNTCAICGITGYGVYIKGIHINELNAEDVLGDGTVSYNAQTATLTLSGADISNSDNSHSLEIDKGDITLVLIGENSLGAGDENHFAVWIENGASLTVSENSTGSLTAPTGLKTTDNYGYLSQEKIYVNRSITGGGDFTVKGGTVSGCIFMGGDIAITGGTVNADYLAAENVTISGGSVTAVGKANIEYYDINAPYGTYGIYADNNILISGGTVTASGGYASVNESALKLNSISKATATAAMYAGNAIDITGGTVTATGGQWNNHVPDPLGFMKLGSYTETPSDFANPDTVIDLYGKALKAQSFTISDNAVFICGSDTTHDMQYCAGDAENTIAYKCVFCGKNAENVTATVNAEDAVYNGSAYDKASVVYGDSWNSSKNLVITYTGTTFGGEDYNSTTAPSAAGEYTASVTVGGVTASAQFTISKATLTADDFTFTPPVERVYDGEEKQATVATDKTGMGEITVHYYNSDGEETAPVDAGTYTVKIDVAEGENYSVVNGLTDNHWILRIQKADPVFTAPQAIEGLAYTGQPQVLVTPGTSDHGTFFYHIIGDEDSPELPTGTEVRTYEISWQLKGDKNHFNSSPKYLNVTISTADQTPLKITGIPDTVTYGDTFTLSATGGDGQGGMHWAVSRGGYNATIDQQGNVTVDGTGDFTVTLIRYGDHHYNDASVSHTFTSQPKQLTDAVVSVDGGLVYNGASHTPAVTVTLDGVTLKENTDYTLEYNNNINASAQAIVTAKGMGNYTGTADKTFEIEKADVTADMFELTYPDNLIYNGNAKTVTAAVKVGFTGVGDILVKYYDENGDLVTEAVNAGKYTVKLSVSEGENYLATQEPIFQTDGPAWEFEITKATYDMSNVKWNRTTGEPFEFDGNTHTVELTGLPQGVTASYTENSKTPVGTYIAKAELNYDSENYNTPDAIPSLEWYIEWNAAENKDYTINSAGTPNSDGWYNSQIHIIPADDYIFYTNNDVSEEDLITLNEDTADGSVTFRVYDPETLSMSYGKTVTYKLDTTAPTGTVSVEENSWTAFLNSITFNKFFNKTVDVKVEAADITSGVKSVEYIESSTALTLDELKQIANWTDMGADNKASVTAEEAKQFVYYIRITDNADNVTIISTDGMAFDLTTPVITGVTNGTTYYTTQKFTVTEANIADVKVNDATVTDYTLAGNVDETYKVVVTDKAGNSTKVTVQMKTIASISETIKDLTESNVTGDNTDTIKAVEEALAAVDKTNASPTEKDEITTAQENIEALQKAIEDTEKEVSDIEAETGALNPDTVTSDDKAEVEQIIDEMTDKLDDANLTEAQKDRIQQSIDEAKEILDKIAEDQENLNDALDSVPAVDTDNVTDSDIDNLEEVKENLEELLNDENYTAEEKAEIQGKLDEIKDIANDIGETYEIVHGADGKWTKGSSKTLGFTADGLFKLFVEVRVDGNVITRDMDYIAQSGSTIVTLNKDYLDTLSVGKHKLEVVYDILGEESIADCEFTVKAKPADNSDKTEPATTPAPSPVPTAKPTAKPTVTPEPSEEPVEEPDTTITGVDPGDETQQKDEVETVTPQEPAETSSFPALPIIIAVAAIFIIIIIFKKKNKEETEE